MKHNHAEYIGKRYGKLVVIEKAETLKPGHTRFLCHCDCGNAHTVGITPLNSGLTKSCGCNSSFGKKGEKKDAAKVQTNIKDYAGKRIEGFVVIEMLPHEAGKAVKWKCLCDCGKEFISSRTALSKRKSCGCLRERKGDAHPAWRGGGRYTDQKGYVSIRQPDHANAFKNGYVLEHVAVMSEAIGRPLIKGETVHHKNGIRNDNRPENLELWASRQPKGQRVEDLIAFAKEILDTYSPLA